jgi:DNA-binding winged helix-turn-helix (wHTH) protein
MRLWDSGGLWPKANLTFWSKRKALQEQPFQILQILLERPGGLVTREELRERVCPADTFVDFDHGLYSAMARLRAAR